MKIITREDAESQGLKRYYTGKPCRRGHAGERYTGSRKCVECTKESVYRRLDKNREFMKNRYRNNKKKLAAESRAYHHANKLSISEKHKKYRIENKEHLDRYHRDWMDNNAEHVSKYQSEYREKNKEILREYNKRYYLENRHLYSAYRRKRQAAEMQRAIPLSDSHTRELIHLYEQCSLLRNLGYDYHVDHVVPLRGKSVSGLHVPWNLQVIPADINRSKGNRFVSYIEVHA